MRVYLAACLLLLSAGAASAALDDKGYDDAVNCKAISLLSANAKDDASKAALKNIEAKIAASVTPNGRTRAQADADIEYSRYDYHDNGVPAAELASKWTACAARWAKP
jgi:hypothetical protein